MSNLALETLSLIATWPQERAETDPPLADRMRAAASDALYECRARSEVIAPTSTDDQPGKSGDTRFACDRSERRPQQSPTASDEVRELRKEIAHLEIALERAMVAGRTYRLCDEARKHALREVIRVLETNTTAIVDTVWVSTGAPETLLDYCRSFAGGLPMTQETQAIKQTAIEAAAEAMDVYFDANGYSEFTDSRVVARVMLEAAERTTWCPIETAPADGSTVYLHQAGRVYEGSWFEIPFREFRYSDGCYLGQQDAEAYWMDHKDGNPVEPTEWMPKVPPIAPGGDE